MAGDWIKMRADLRDDPGVFRMADMLEREEFYIVGALHCFWAWADKHAVDGRVDGATSRLIDKVSCTPGFSAALCAVGWLVVDPDGVSLPNFERHNGESAKERGLKNARQARWRAKKDGDVGVDVDGKASTQSSTDASTREEKRREEEIPSVDKSTGDAGADVPDPIFGDGVQYLVRTGYPEKSARSFLGKMRKALRDDFVAAELLAKAQQLEVSDPVPWLRAAAQKRMAPSTLGGTNGVAL